MTLAELHDKLENQKITTKPIGPGFNAALRTAEALFEQQNEDIPTTVRILRHQLTFGAKDPFDRGFQEGIKAAIRVISPDTDSAIPLTKQELEEHPGVDYDESSFFGWGAAGQPPANPKWCHSPIVGTINPANPSIVGLTGLAGSGKDTVAALLSMLGYERMAFADPLRAEAAEYIRMIKDRVSGNGVTRCEQQYGKDIVALIHSGAIKPDDVYLKPTPPAIREILQRHGTEFRRAQDENYWVRRVFDAHTMPGLLVISDVRFPNEAQAIRDRGGVIWRVERFAAGAPTPAAHVSESGQAAIAADATIDNNESLIELAKKVKALLPCEI